MRRLIICVTVLFFALAGSAYASGFGVQSFEAAATNRPTPEQQANHEPGSPDVQAGSHPYALTTNFVMNESERRASGIFVAAGGGVKDVRFELPPGFVGNPNAVPKCPYRDFLTKTAVESGTACPDNTAVGEATVGFGEPRGYNSKKLHRVVDDALYYTNPVYNVEPPGGVPAELGIMVAKAHPVLLDASVRTGGDYGITVTSPNITQTVVAVSTKVTVWGVPADPSHDRLRGNCHGEAVSEAATEEPPNDEESLREGEEEGKYGKGRAEHPEAPASCPANIPVQPFLTNPTSCGESRAVKMSVDDWNEPGNFATGEHVISKSVSLPELSGCEHLDFSPTITVQPDGSAGSTPTGLNVDLHVPQESTSNPVGLGEADIRTTTVALPAGTSISPSAADGLQACTGNPSDPPGTPDNEIGFEGSREYNPLSAPGSQTLTFSPKLPQPLEPGVNFCPDASKIANVHIKTPLLEGEVAGSIYLAAPQNFKFAGAPQENPFRSLLAVYLVASEPATGVLVKLPGRITLCESQGQTVDGKLPSGGSDHHRVRTHAAAPVQRREARILRHRPCSACHPRVVRDVYHDVVP